MTEMVQVQINGKVHMKVLTVVSIWSQKLCKLFVQIAFLQSKKTHLYHFSIGFKSAEETN